MKTMSEPLTSIQSNVMHTLSASLGGLAVQSRAVCLSLLRYHLGTEEEQGTPSSSIEMHHRGHLYLEKMNVLWYSGRVALGSGVDGQAWNTRAQKVNTRTCQRDQHARRRWTSLLPSVKTTPLRSDEARIRDEWQHERHRHCSRDAQQP